jgi:hypothetical protein
MMVTRSLNAFFTEKRAATPKVVHLAEYHPSDPFLIVASDGGAELYLLDFPPLEKIDEHTVVPVYSGEVFLGPDIARKERELSRNHAVAAINKRSEAIGQ